jgi:hypothetical protein
MNRENKSRTGSSHNGGNSEKKGDRKQVNQPGAPSRSNRQTKGHESGPEKESGTKKGPNSV